MPDVLITKLTLFASEARWEAEIATAQGRQGLIHSMPVADVEAVVAEMARARTAEYRPREPASEVDTPALPIRHWLDGEIVEAAISAAA